MNRSHGILTVCPSGAAFAIPLGPTNSSLIVIAKKTLVFRRRGFQPRLWLLVPTFLLPHAPESVTLLLHSRAEYSPTAPRASLLLGIGKLLSLVSFISC